MRTAKKTKTNALNARPYSLKPTDLIQQSRKGFLQLHNLDTIRDHFGQRRTVQTLPRTHEQADTLNQEPEHQTILRPRHQSLRKRSTRRENKRNPRTSRINRPSLQRLHHTSQLNRNDRTTTCLGFCCYSFLDFETMVSSSKEKEGKIAEDSS